MPSIEELFQQANLLSGQQRSEFLNGLPEQERALVEAKIGEANTILPSRESPTVVPPKPPQFNRADEAPEQTMVSSRGHADRPADSSELNSFGEYDLIDEIARGGMGVVYRARHRKLNRIVALKMILSGQFASQEDVARFYLEAEAAANLDHAGITPIYDVGDEQGQPFFAMKLIEGGSVESSIGVFEKDLRKSAELIVQVALAIHHAHQRGILHRDLKPNNILLDEDRNPLVTDFGLAKMTDRESGHTRTGAIMGTPAYMAPEQAGSGKSVTTSADIYSLGAILYRLITGQPTYQADSALDIVMKSLNEDPAPPRELNTAIPLDLELICLKCLQREPTLRYNSAADLAEDLEHWLAGEPVSVRPPSVGTLASVWMKQNVQMAVGAALVGSLTGALISFSMFAAVFSVNFDFVASTYRDYFPQQKPPLMAIPFQSPSWSFPVVLVGWPLLIAICGYFVVRVTKPPSRQAAASSGLIAGAFCAGLMAMVGTIGPLMSSTIGQIEEDLNLLSTAAYGDEVEAKSARRSLINRYPDLEKYSESDRGIVIQRKIRSDLIAGLPIGLWGGFSVFLMTMPLVMLGSIYAWRLQSHNWSKLYTFFKYIDAAFAFSILISFLILLFLTRPLGAGIYIPPFFGTVMLVGALVIALAAAIKAWSWYLRVPIHLVWIVLVAFYCMQVMRAPYGSQIADQQMYAGNMDGAASALELKLNAQPSREYTRMRLGILYAKMGDREQYYYHCKEILRYTEGTRNPDMADKAAKLCLLLPSEKENLKLATEMSERAVKYGEGSKYYSWFLLVRGLAAYRNGEFQRAVEYLNNIDRNRYFVINCTADMVLTMCHYNIGDVKQAEYVFENGTNWMEEAWNKYYSKGEQTANWHDRFVYEILRDEARSVLGTE